jgi:hypothetical protein
MFPLSGTLGLEPVSVAYVRAVRAVRASWAVRAVEVNVRAARF